MTWPFYDRALNRYAGPEQRAEIYGFYLCTLPSAWQALKHLFKARWLTKYDEAVKAGNEDLQAHYAGRLGKFDSPQFASQVSRQLRVARTSAFAFGALTVVSYIAERKGMLTAAVCLWG